MPRCPIIIAQIHCPIIFVSSCSLASVEQIAEFGLLFLGFDWWRGRVVIGVGGERELDFCMGFLGLEEIVFEGLLGHGWDNSNN
jgi:hypothetical protein